MASHRRGLSSIPGQSMRHLCLHCVSTPILSCQYHSSSTPLSTSSTCCSHQRDKQAKSGTLPKRSTPSKIRGGRVSVCVCVKNSVYALTAISKINKARTANTNLLFEIPLLALIKAGKAHSQIWKYEQNTAWHNMNPNTQHDTMYSY